MKIGFLITARLKSSRLPFKILKDLNGKKVIERIIDRAKEVDDISEIVLCTSTNPQDKPLIDIAKKNDIYYFNGSEEDVLQRLLSASQLYSMDYIVGITADNPLFTIYYSNRIVDEFKRNNYDYIKLKGLPLGCATYGMKVKALETICAVKNIVDTEIWGPLIDRPELFNIKTIEVDQFLRRPDYRLTLDYIEDYVLLNNIYKNVPFKNVIKLYDVIDYLDQNPEIVSINSNCTQLNLDDKTLKIIEKNFLDNIKTINKIKEEIYSQ
ncbi:cytidylyltransferase domain-containing protein [Halothermothrix orenii]|uniref:3-deoxy-manno-octulosonate cytidylyltransferase n=1 Tax=Halothermothrix orenii (strain H 168 / OCM 544 / DSM 9562) TaxID=373903 RepID=B8CYS9_HALOH|nr:glycosyltransferase family protein [Halothermothrix orenii]ACL70448.1 3-deoxy-manno-octulosonate cytidylyltransferase [Halothermothrix orenii H 168]